MAREGERGRERERERGREREREEERGKIKVRKIKYEGVSLLYLVIRLLQRYSFNYLLVFCSNDVECQHGFSRECWAKVFLCSFYLHELLMTFQQSRVR